MSKVTCGTSELVVIWPMWCLFGSRARPHLKRTTWGGTLVEWCSGPVSIPRLRVPSFLWCLLCSDYPHSSWVSCVVGARGALAKQRDYQRSDRLYPSRWRQKLLETCLAIAAKPMVSSRQLATFTGGPIIPGRAHPAHAAVPRLVFCVADAGKHGSGSDGVPGPSRKLIHVRRFQSALQWAAALLKDEKVTLKKEDIQNVIGRSPGQNHHRCLTLGHRGGAQSLRQDRRRLCTPTGRIHLEQVQSSQRLWLPRFGCGAIVRVKSDSLSSLLMLTGRAKSPELNTIAREIALDQALQLYSLTFLEHITGLINLEADCLSRVYAPRVPVKPRQLEEALLSPFTIGEGFWKVKKPAR